LFFSFVVSLFTTSFLFGVMARLCFAFQNRALFSGGGVLDEMRGNGMRMKSRMVFLQEIEDGT